MLTSFQWMYGGRSSLGVSIQCTYELCKVDSRTDTVLREFRRDIMIIDTATHLIRCATGTTGLSSWSDQSPWESRSSMLALTIGMLLALVQIIWY